MTTAATKTRLVSLSDFYFLSEKKAQIICDGLPLTDNQLETLMGEYSDLTQVEISTTAKTVTIHNVIKASLKQYPIEIDATKIEFGTDTIPSGYAHIRTALNGKYVIILSYMVETMMDESEDTLRNCVLYAVCTATNNSNVLFLDNANDSQ